MPDFGVLAVLMGSAFVHGAFGFGFPLMATPLLALLMDMRAAVLLTLIPTLTINLFSIAGERRWRDAIRRFWPIPAFAIVGSLSGTQLLLTVDPEPFRLLLALVLIGYLLSDRFTRADKERSVPGWGMALLGFSVGLLAGVVNVFAPILVVYALYTRMDPTLMVATFNICFLFSKSGQLIGFTANDALEPTSIEASLWSLPFAVLSLWLGIWTRRRIDVRTYRRLLRIALWLIAAVLVGDWARRL